MDLISGIRFWQLHEENTIIDSETQIEKKFGFPSVSVKSKRSENEARSQQEKKKS